MQKCTSRKHTAWWIPTKGIDEPASLAPVHHRPSAPRGPALLASERRVIVPVPGCIQMGIGLFSSMSAPRPPLYFMFMRSVWPVVVNSQMTIPAVGGDVGRQKAPRQWACRGRRHAGRWSGSIC